MGVLPEGTCVVVVMGVSGVGKSVVGRALADALGWAFVDADDLHPPDNVAKMAAGQPLDDRDRGPWLDAVAAAIAAHAQRQPAVIACSALRRSHRERLGLPRRGVALVHLVAPPAVIGRRMRRRRHFMPASLQASQAAALESPAPHEGAVVLDATAPVEELVATLT